MDFSELCTSLLADHEDKDEILKEVDLLAESVLGSGLDNLITLEDQLLLSERLRENQFEEEDSYKKILILAINKHNLRIELPEDWQPKIKSNLLLSEENIVRAKSKRRIRDLSERQIAIIVDLYQRGRSRRDLASALQIGKNAVSILLKKNNVVLQTHQINHRLLPNTYKKLEYISLASQRSGFIESYNEREDSQEHLRSPEGICRFLTKTAINQKFREVVIEAFIDEIAVLIVCSRIKDSHINDIFQKLMNTDITNLEEDTDVLKISRTYREWLQKNQDMILTHIQSNMRDNFIEDEVLYTIYPKAIERSKELKLDEHDIELLEEGHVMNPLLQDLNCGNIQI